MFAPTAPTIKVRDPCGCNLYVGPLANVAGYYDYGSDFCAFHQAANAAAYAAKMALTTYADLSPFDMGTDAANELHGYQSQVSGNGRPLTY